MDDSAPLWQPTSEAAANSNMTAFMGAVARDWNVHIDGYADLHQFSIENAEKFWVSVRDFVAITAETWGDEVVVDGDRMPGAKWFPDARLNFAENLLRRRDDGDAIVFRGEDQAAARITFAELYDAVSRLAQAFAAAGIEPGDCIGAYLPNMPETIVAMLAASSLGAVWSSCSPDFGMQGVLDRFGQIEPKLVIAVDGYHYNGKPHDCLEKLSAILAELPSVERCIIVPYTRDDPPLDTIPNGVLIGDFVAGFEAGDIAFRHLPFNHPLYILYSSGTTGVPKCIVHGAGGTLLQHMKEQIIHCDVKPGDRVFYFTTCGWMMWNWLATMLAAEATLLLYDGAPFYPDGNVLWDFAEAEKMTLFGTSAKFIDALAKAEIRPQDTHDLSSLRLITSTGSPLAPEGFDYVYAAIKADVHLASIAGGTDIIACFVGGNPLGPVWRGEIQAPMLGMDVQVFDDSGSRIVGEKGELVCTNTFPSMPIGFWNDPDDAKYKAAYFERFDNVWCHGDYVEETEHGGTIMFGRSDATLNPGGVRIGTSEIYRQVERFDEVIEGIVIGQEWDSDTRIVLFVVLRDGLSLDGDLEARIRTRIRANCSPRHVPARIVQVADIPRTKSGKITELAVRDVVHGRPIKNAEALANPEALDLYKDLTALQA
jgi:acetoacetyl-CoA synthetase